MRKKKLLNIDSKYLDKLNDFLKLQGTKSIVDELNRSLSGLFQELDDAMKVRFDGAD